MSVFTIDPEKCNRDKICVKACPTNVIRMGSTDGMPEPTRTLKNIAWPAVTVLPFVRQRPSA